MKIQLAYKLLKEKNKEQLKEDLTKIVGALGKHDVYCPLLDPDLPDNEKEVFEKSFNEINARDALIAIKESDEDSEGMLIEVGYSLALDKRVIGAIHKDVQDTRLSYLCPEIIEYKTIDELCEKLKRIE